MQPLSTQLTEAAVSIKLQPWFMEGFPSGQRGQTVNLLLRFRRFESFPLHQPQTTLKGSFFCGWWRGKCDAGPYSIKLIACQFGVASKASARRGAAQQPSINPSNICLAKASPKGQRQHAFDNRSPNKTPAKQGFCLIHQILALKPLFFIQVVFQHKQRHKTQ